MDMLSVLLNKIEISAVINLGANSMNRKHIQVYTNMWKSSDELKRKIYHGSNTVPRSRNRRCTAMVKSAI